MSKIRIKDWNPTKEQLDLPILSVKHFETAEIVGLGRVDKDDIAIPFLVKEPTEFHIKSLDCLFYDDVSNLELAHALAIMACCYRHTFKVLTKRPQGMVNALEALAFQSGEYPAENVLFGVCDGDQDTSAEFDGVAWQPYPPLNTDKKDYEVA